MSDNSELNPQLMASDNDAAGAEQIFRPNVLGTDTAESRILTPASEINYHSVSNRAARGLDDDVQQTREAESIQSIFDRLDHDEGNPNNRVEQPSVIEAQQSLDSQESEIRSIITEEYNKILSTMRVDMVSIIQLLQTLHPKVKEQTQETDSIKEDIYNLVQAVSRLRDLKDM